MSGKQEVLVAADDPLGAQKGDTVVVESSSRQLLGIAALVYLLPLVLFFAGYFLGGALGWGEAGSVTAAAAGFLLGILAAVLYSRREKKRGDVLFTVTSIKG
jgi:sigma-E factor negative regulatory protein RseC